MGARAKKKKQKKLVASKPAPKKPRPTAKIRSRNKAVSRARIKSPIADTNRHALLTLLELTQNLTDDHPLEESLRIVTEAALDLVPGDHTSIRLLDGTHTELLSGARSGAGETLPPMTFRRGEGMIGWVVEHRAGVRVGDVDRDPRFKPTPKAHARFDIRSIVAEP